MRQTTLALALGAVFTSAAHAETLPEFVGETIIVTPTRVPIADVDAPFASEVHTHSMIVESGAASLYDYLAQHTSVQVLPSYGNRFTPRIDMRGYGIGDGYQNIVVSLDGRRLNNIDGVPQLIGAIPMADIDRIEITKGSGSVLFGDGATAGTIQIYTKPHRGVALAVSAGDYGSVAGTATAGLSTEKLRLSASADYSRLDGYSATDPSGHTDESSSHTLRGSLAFNPHQRVEIGLDAGNSRIDARYPSPLTLAQFEEDPAQVGSNPWVTPVNAYSHQKLESDAWRIQTKLELNRGWNLMASHSQEDKLSNFVSWNSESNYDYSTDELALQYRGGAFDLTTGMQTSNGTRVGSDNHTSKDNTGWYVQGQYRFGRTLVSAGARRERVEYVYAPDAGAVLRADHKLTAWDLGVNHRLDEQFSLFANYNRGFQAPDIDRFFSADYSVFPPLMDFNGFITPAMSRTATVGLNHVTPANRLKAALFRADLDNEIYYNALTYTNTNLDETHKYGLELQDTWRATEALTATFNYTWTRAIIDQEGDVGGAYNGMELPGVPRHGVALGLNWRLTPTSSFSIAHTWRSETWAAEDFDNDNAQKQAAYQSTNLAYRYRHKQWEGFVAVDNVFEESNGIWIRDDAIYPVNFTRTWRVGVKADF
jgi:iron complex outermembrane receptor protein